MDSVIGVIILLGITGYIAFQRKTTFVQWVLILALIFIGYTLNGENKTVSILIFGALLGAIYIKERRRKGLKILPRMIRKKTKKSTQNKVNLQPAIQLLDDFSIDQQKKQVQDLKNSKKTISTMSQEIESLRKENFNLKKLQEENEAIAKASPRLRHYQKMTKKVIVEQKIDLSQFKEKRLREELQRQRDENRELKKNQNR